MNHITGSICEEERDNIINAQKFLPLFIEALYQVHQDYYRQELWREPDWFHIFEGNENQNNILELKEYLDRYGERVFCYELYHQIRLLMREPDGDGVMFQAELKKDVLHRIKQHFPDIIKGLDKAYIPDFLLHAPGNFDHQELIIEVKSNPHISISDLAYDLQKINEFIDKYQYKAGLFLTINTHPEQLENMLHTIRKNGWMEKNLTQRERILVICKPSQREEHVEWHLSSF